MYIITFEDNTKFKGGSFKDTLWTKMPDKKIKKIFYDFGKKKFEFTGYEAYNLLIEKATVFNRGSSIRKVFLMARDNNQVISVVIDLVKQNIVREIRKAGEEWRGQMTTGWKFGVKGKPKILMNP